MNRYVAMFDSCRDEGRIAFGGFLMLGHPSSAATGELLDALVEGGADMVELGIPFSDPVADGPVIARAAKQALDGGVTPDDCLEMIADFRARHPDIPIGILTYANIVVARGRAAFARELASAGADSLLVADVPSVEAEPWAEDMKAAGIDLDRKILADLAVADEAAFKAIFDQAKTALDAKHQSAKNAA